MVSPLSELYFFESSEEQNQSKLGKNTIILDFVDKLFVISRVLENYKEREKQQIVGGKYE